MGINIPSGVQYWLLYKIRLNLTINCTMDKIIQIIPSNYITIIVIVTLSHADSVRFILQLITFYVCTPILSTKSHDSTLHHLSYSS